MMELNEAVRKGDLDRVREVLELKTTSDINGTDEAGFNALHYAIQGKHFPIVEVLCEHGADVNKQTSLGLFKTPLYLAVEGGSLEIIKLLMTKRADVDKQTDSDRWSRDGGQTPLHCAAYKGRLEIVKHLVDGGANINAKDGDGWTALHSATFLGRQEIADFLISKGSNVEAEDTDGVTAVNYASERGNLDMVAFLARNGASLEKKDTDGLTPLHQAARRDNLTVVQYLIEGGSNVDEGDSYGGTPLHYAARENHRRIVTFLVNNGASIDQGDADGETAVHHATDRGNLNVLRILLEKGADVNKKTGDGLTALKIASMRGHTDVVRFFLRKGALVGEGDIDYAFNDSVRKILWRFQKDGVILDEDDETVDVFDDDECGGTPTEEELMQVADTIQTVFECWSFCKELKMDGDIIANALPISDTARPAREILRKWEGGIKKKSEKKRILKTLDEYDLIGSTRGLSFEDIIGQVARTVASVSQLMKMCATLGIEAEEVIHVIESTACPPQQKIIDCCLVLLAQWVNDGGKRDDLLQGLQARHLNESAEVVSSAIQQLPDSVETFSFSSVGHEGGKIEVGDGDVQMIVPQGALPQEVCEVLTIKVPDHISEIPEDLVTEGEFQPSPSVQCSPSGLHFTEPVKIIIPHCMNLSKVTDKSEIILYTSDESGTYTREVLQPEDYNLSENEIEVNVRHFSNIGVSLSNIGSKLEVLNAIKFGLLPYHPVYMPETRRPILQLYVYHMMKRNEKKIVRQLKKLGQKYRKATAAMQLIMETDDDLTITCSDGTNEIEEKLSCSKLIQRKQNRLTFELDFSDQEAGTKNIALKLFQGDKEIESQVITTELKESKATLKKRRRSSASDRGRPASINETSVSSETLDPFHQYLLTLAEEIDNDLIIQLGVALKFSMAKIKRYIETNKLGATVSADGTFHMLCDWYRKPTRDKIDELRSALIQVGLVELAESYFPNAAESQEASEGTTESTDVKRVPFVRSDSMVNELANRPMWAAMAGTVNKKYRGVYSLTRASSKK